MSPTASNQDPLLSLGKRFETCNSYLLYTPLAVTPSKTMLVMLQFRVTLDLLQRETLSCDHLIILKYYRIKIISLYRVFDLILYTFPFKPDYAVQRDLSWFFWNYLDFMGSGLSPRKVIKCLWQVSLHPRFSHFWDKQQTALFSYLEKHFPEPIPTEQLDLFLYVIATAKNLPINQKGMDFLQKRMLITRSLFYFSFLFNLHAYRKKEPWEPNGLLRGQYSVLPSSSHHLKQLSIWLLNFLFREDSLKVPAMRITNRNIQQILIHLARGNHLELTIQLFKWHGCHQRHLTEALFNLPPDCAAFANEALAKTKQLRATLVSARSNINEEESKSDDGSYKLHLDENENFKNEDVSGKTPPKRPPELSSDIWSDPRFPYSDSSSSLSP